jgi:hypothetical protein
VLKESLPFYIDGVTVGTNIIIADICRQTARTNEGLFMEFAFEYSHVPKLLDERFPLSQTYLEEVEPPDPGIE